MAAVPRIRPWSGPALLSYGFRPFFLLVGVQAVWTMALWTLVQLGLVDLPAAWPAAAWHAHELLFGYGAAALAGFLLTAIPNWTGRLPLSGLPLAGLAGLWILGRLAVASAGLLPASAVALASLLFPAALLIVTGREVAAGRNRRNYPVIALVGLLLPAQLAFHRELAAESPAPVAAHAALALGLLLTARIAPLPPAFPGLVACLAGLAHLFRLARWQPFSTLAEPLLWVLHSAYLFVPMGFLAAGLGLLLDRPGLVLASTHLWTVGAIGLMTLAVMTRATRGHTGRVLHAPPETTFAYLALGAAAIFRAAAALLPEASPILVPTAGLLWLLAFAIFLAAYAPMLLAPRVPAGSPA
jgi:uncharacterized protein involved in response to NO